MGGRNRSRVSSAVTGSGVTRIVARTADLPTMEEWIFFETNDRRAAQSGSPLTRSPYSHNYGHMKTTIELPDPLLRRAKVLAAQRGSTLRELVIEGLQQVTGATPGAASGASMLSREEAAVAETGRHGLPVLKRPASARKSKVTRALVDRLREDLAL